MTPEESWRTTAECRNLSLGEAESLFFPGHGKKSKPAKNYCVSSQCPVREECVAFATLNSLQGTWGGTTEKERRSFVALRAAKETAAASNFKDLKFISFH